MKCPCLRPTQQVRDTLAEVRHFCLLVDGGCHAGGRLAGGSRESHPGRLAPCEGDGVGGGEQPGDGAGLAGARSAADHRDPARERLGRGLALQPVHVLEQLVQDGFEPR